MTWLLAVLLFTSGCASKLSRAPSSLEVPHCLQSCGENEICLNTFTDKGAICSPKPEIAPLQGIELPFDQKTQVFCTHSSGMGSHSGQNAFYAIDLANAYEEPPAVVRAAAGGIAFVFGAEDGSICPEPSGSAAKSEASTCGDSWGNRVKILHDHGYYSFYVHLDHALIKTGTIVKKGDPIGIEGSTGAAGHRHLHWSVQRLPGEAAVDWIRQISWAGQSVPFRFLARQRGELKVFDVSELRCAHAGVGLAPAEEQPSFTGVR